MSTSLDRHDQLDTRRLAVPVAALLATEVLHIAATVANDGQPSAHHAELGPPAHLLAVVLTAGLLVWIRLRRPHAGTLTAIAGAAVVVTATIYHVLPVDSDYLNPFRDGATTLQWISIVVGVLTGAWCVGAGLRTPQLTTAVRSRPAR